MAAINIGRVLLGGFVAGVVANACDALIYGVLLKDDWQNVTLALGLDPAAMETTGAMVGFILCDFVIGFLLVITYASVRPRFGPGPRTAIYAGLIIFLAMAIAGYGFLLMGIVPQDVFAVGMLYSLLTMVLASLAGGWVYAER